MNHDGELVPCLHGSVNRKHCKRTSFSGSRAWDEKSGPYRDECIIGENFEFIKFHNDAVAEHLKENPLLPVPFEKGFGLNDSI